MSSQNSVFPLTPSVEVTDEEPRMVDMLTEQGTRMLDALASETARAILDELSDEPATTSDVAECVDTTLQNVHYHMDRLEEAGLVRVVGTHYSSRGTEMDVYAPDGSPLMLVGGDVDTADVSGDAEEAAVEAATVRSD